MTDMTEIRLAERMGRLGTESAFEVLARAKASNRTLTESEVTQIVREVRS